MTPIQLWLPPKHIGKNISLQVVEMRFISYCQVSNFDIQISGGAKHHYSVQNTSESFHHTATCLSYHCVIAIELLGLLQPPAVLCHNHRSHFRLAWKLKPVQNPETSWNITNKAHVSEFWSLLISSDQFCSVQPRHWDPICRAVHTVAEQRPISQLPHRLSCRIRETEHSQPLLRLQPIRPPPRISPTSWPPRPKACNAKDADLENSCLFQCELWTAAQSIHLSSTVINNNIIISYIILYIYVYTVIYSARPVYMPNFTSHQSDPLILQHPPKSQQHRAPATVHIWVKPPQGSRPPGRPHDFGPNRTCPNSIRHGSEEFAHVYPRQVAKGCLS